MSVFGRLTLAIIKPDACASPPRFDLIRRIIEENGFKVLAQKYRRYSQKEMEQFYAEHESKFFYHRLVTYMSLGPAFVGILSKGNDTITSWRALLGPSKVFRTIHEEPESIRGKCGLTDTRNAVHGSDSVGSAQREIGFFFPELSEGELKELLGERPQSKLFHSSDSEGIEK